MCFDKRKSRNIFYCQYVRFQVAEGYMHFMHSARSQEYIFLRVARVYNHRHMYKYKGQYEQIKNRSVIRPSQCPCADSQDAKRLR